MSKDSGKDEKPLEIMRSRVFLGIISFIFVGGVLGMLVSLFTAEAVERTSDAKFCGSCHSMEPMTKSYHLSKHGGKNKDGLVATCADCHLPHDGTFNYMMAKTKAGINDVYVEFVVGAEGIDWHERRTHRAKYTYDSACMKCHKNLQDSTMGNTKAFIAHKAYFQKDTTKTCVECHEHVGHKNLGLFLQQKGEPTK